MKKTISMTYPADPQRVATMLSDSDYQRGRIDRFGLEDATVDVAARGQGFVATIAGSVPPSRLPAAAKRFVRSTISFTLAESWGEPADDGARTGDIDITLKGAPVNAGATTAMRPAGENATEVTIEVDLNVSVPLVGHKIEEKAMSMTDRAVADEEERAAAWLAAH